MRWGIDLSLYIFNYIKIDHFLSLFRNHLIVSGFSRQVEDILTWEALRSILSVLSSDTEDPWSEPPAFKVITLKQYVKNASVIYFKICLFIYVDSLECR